MKSVALITSQAFSVANFRGDLIRDLVASGVKVWALAPDYDAKTISSVEALGAEVVSYPLSRSGLNPLSDLKSLVGLWIWLRKNKPDVVLSYFIKPVIYGTLAAWLAGISRRIAMIEGLGFVFSEDETESSIKRKWLKKIAIFLYGFSLDKAHSVLVLNSDDQKDLQSFGLVDQHQCINLGGIGVDLTVWRQVPLVAEPITFVMVARLLKEKGVYEYLKAAEQVLKKHPNAQFWLLGAIDSGPSAVESTVLQDFVDKGVVTWPGHVDVKPWLEKATVFVLPSYYREGVPRSTQEALALGKPVITTDMPGCRDTVVHEVNGYLIEAKSTPALVNAMCRCIEEINNLAAMGQKSRQMAEQKFDVRVINQRLMTLLEGAAV